MSLFCEDGWKFLRKKVCLCSTTRGSKLGSLLRFADGPTMKAIRTNHMDGFVLLVIRMKIQWDPQRHVFVDDFSCSDEEGCLFNPHLITQDSPMKVWEL